MESVDDIVRRAIALLEERVGIDALWLFGSRAVGAANQDSDIDLAVLLRQPVPPLELLEARSELSAELGCDVDVIDLDRASPILVMQVLRNGRLLLDRSPERRLTLTAHAPGWYEDVRIVRREAELALRERMHRGRP
jgi:predicted nucleotidyltransferase